MLRDTGGGGPFDEAQMLLHMSKEVALSLTNIASTTASRVELVNDIGHKHFWNNIFK